MTQAQVRKLLRSKLKPYGYRGVGRWCKKHRINQSEVSLFLNKKRNATNAILNAIDLEWRIVRKR